MFETIGRSFRLAKLCLRVLAADKELIVLPLLSSIGVVLLLLTFAGVGIGIGALDRIEAGEPGAGDIIVAAVFYILASFVIIFFNSALVYAAHERLSGGDPTVGSGIGGAWNRVLTIFVWAVIAGYGRADPEHPVRARRGSAAAVLGIVSAIIISLIGAAWTLITYFRRAADRHRAPLARGRVQDIAVDAAPNVGRAGGGQLRPGNRGIRGVPRGGRGDRAAVLRAVATGDCGHRHGDRGRRRADRGGRAGLRGAGRDLQGCAVHVCVERRGAGSLPGRRDTGRVSAEVDQLSNAGGVPVATVRPCSSAVAASLVQLPGGKRHPLELEIVLRDLEEQFA